MNELAALYKQEEFENSQQASKDVVVLHDQNSRSPILEALFQSWQADRRLQQRPTRTNSYRGLGRVQRRRWWAHLAINLPRHNLSQ
jgi:hypothetical protein